MITNSADETQKIGLNLAKQLKAGSIVCLYGNLGFGKTTFVQGFAKGLGVIRRIISPTFVIIRKYEINHGDASVFYHIDLYRINSINEVQNIGLEEILNDQNSIKAIEWSEKLGELLPKKRIDVHFKYINEQSREIIINE